MKDEKNQPPAAERTAPETPQPPAAVDQSPAAPPSPLPEEPAAEPTTAAPEPTLVVIPPQDKSQALASPPAEPAAPASPEEAQIHVAPNLLDLAAGRAETAAQRKQARQQRDLDHVVHQVLIFGLTVSTSLMLIGIGLEIQRHQDLPTVEPDFGQVFARVAALPPSGFLALGLLVLLATPVLRVIGSIFAFAHERDWRFAAITFVVFLILLSSILLGKG